MPLRQLSLLAVPGLAACDVVWGLSGEPSACELRSFDGIDDREMITDGDQFTVSSSGKRAIVDATGKQFERELDVEVTVEITVGLPTTKFISLGPEGDLLFHSQPAEPMHIEQATRTSDGIWIEAARNPPKGAIAGVPSASEFGPRHVIVRTRGVGSGILEYEEDGDAWLPVGDEQPFPGALPPNLTPNGLTMVFVDADPATGEPAVFAANRASVSESFGEPRLLRVTAGGKSGQLLGNSCDTLFVSESGALRRYDQ